jgi:hemerythrin-like domain-containing protein
MKRHPALHPLSHDHHQALFVAQRLRRDAPAEAVPRFLEFWTEHGRRHFQIEEEILFPAWAEAASGYEEEMVVRALRDHHAIRAAARRLAGGADDPGELRELGERLDAHVRFEEREMFPAIESSLHREALAALAEEIARAEGMAE